MGEAIITSRLGHEIDTGSGGDVITLPNYTSLVVTVKDSTGRKVKYGEAQVWLPNGAYYSGWCNEKGQGLFFIPNGIRSVNIAGINRFKDNSNGFIADQSNAFINNINTNTGMTVYANVQLKYKTTGSICLYNGNYKFLNTNYADVYVIGGGGGGLRQTRMEYGGGGGALNMAKNISINKSKLYSFIIGHGGNTGYSVAYTGGTSSAFGLSANGGNGANYSINGAKGGIGMYNGGEGCYRNMTGGDQSLNYRGANSNYIGILSSIGSKLDGINAGTSDPYGEYNQTWTRYVNFANIGHGGSAATMYNDYRGTDGEYSFGSGGHGNSGYTCTPGEDGVVILANFR